MKELSIEEKAKAYDEALKYAMIYYKNGNEDMKMMMKTCFPVLAEESEDERIRKEMIEILKKEAQDFPSSVIAEKSNSWIAWLEKQGEQNLVVVPKFRVGDIVRHIPNEVNMSQVEYRITRIDDKFYYSEWEDGVEFILFGFLVEDTWELVEQKPADEVEPKFRAGDKVISTLTNNPYYITEVCNGYYQTDMGCIIVFNAQDNFELVEQKPV